MVLHAPADVGDDMNRKKTSLASLLAPEDIRRGQYVAVLNEIEQWYPCCSSSGKPELFSVRSVPTDEIELLQVFEICLPFVTVRKADGSLLTLDVRRHELARLDDGYARRVIRRLRNPRTIKRSKDDN